VPKLQFYTRVSGVELTPWRDYSFSKLERSSQLIGRNEVLNFSLLTSRLPVMPDEMEVPLDRKGRMPVTTVRSEPASCPQAHLLKPAECPAYIAATDMFEPQRIHRKKLIGQSHSFTDA
jgi:hypothetical protein